MCIVVKDVKLYPALLNDQLRCLLSQPGEFWQQWPWAAERWCQKAAYLDGWVHYHLLITGGFSGVFITCADQVVCMWLYMRVCVGESGGYCYTGWTAGGQLVCVGGSMGFCFSSAVGLLQYSWALWGSVCCAVLRPPLPLKLPSFLHQTTVSVHLDFRTMTTMAALRGPFRRDFNSHFSSESKLKVVFLDLSFEYREPLLSGCFHIQQLCQSVIFSFRYKN